MRTQVERTVREGVCSVCRAAAAAEQQQQQQQAAARTAERVAARAVAAMTAGAERGDATNSGRRGDILHRTARGAGAPVVVCRIYNIAQSKHNFGNRRPDYLPIPNLNI